MEVFATFDIYNSSMHRVAEGHKASFCLEDNQCLPDVEPRYACADFGDQGYSLLCIFHIFHQIRYAVCSIKFTSLIRTKEYR